MTAERDHVVERLRASRADLQARGVRRLALFGSLARGEARADSDVDVAVEIEPGRSFSLIRLEETRQMLETRLGRRKNGDRKNGDSVPDLVITTEPLGRIPAFTGMTAGVAEKR
jgi:predicted nucleotidyltransferase